MVRASTGPTACKVTQPSLRDRRPRTQDVPAPPLITGETDDPLTFELSCKDEMRVGQKNKLT